MKSNPLSKFFPKNRCLLLCLLLLLPFKSLGAPEGSGYWRLQKEKQDPAQKEESLSKDPGYVALKKALQAYHDFQSQGGEWPSLPSGPKLQLGDQGERVSLLRKRLGMKEEKNIFDEELKKALEDFQRRHGLELDGILGKETLAELNIPLRQRIRQIEANLKRIRWLPRDLGEKYIFVNIPDFHLWVVEGEKVVLDSKIVVGLRKDWQTPLVSSHITHLVVNPKWHVPPKIIEDEILQKLKEDPEYLTKEKMQVFQVKGDEMKEIDPSTVGENGIPTEELRIIQKEGEGNALGRIKFLFPNPYSIYLHDTPQRMLFGTRQRALSHGCVRVQRPLELALFLLKEEEGWNEERLGKAIAQKKTRYLKLSRPVDLHIFYQTAWVDQDGNLNFRRDIYGKD